MYPVDIGKGGPHQQQYLGTFGFISARLDWPLIGIFVQAVTAVSLDVQSATSYLFGVSALIRGAIHLSDWVCLRTSIGDEAG